MLAAILLAALIIARTCGETSTDVSKDQAVEIAKEQVDFVPTDYQVRLLKQGLQSREVWLVGLKRSTDEGDLVNATSVLVDANTGDVIRVETTR